MRTLVLSLLLLTTAAVAQPPMPPKVEPPKPALPSSTESFLYAAHGAEKPPAKGSVEEAILNAQRNHPDIKLAEAKRQMADAEVEQARFLVAQRVAAGFAKVEQAKAALVTAEEYSRRMKGAGTPAEAMSAYAQYQRVKSELMAAELELKAATGVAARPVGVVVNPDLAAVEAGMRWLARTQEAGIAPAKPAPVGSVADKLKALLDKPAKLDLKVADLDDAMAAALKAVGEPALTVKLPMLGKKYLKEPPTVTFAGEMPFTAAVQFILDEVNEPFKSNVPPMMKGKYDVYVREYGLLVARAEDAPKDAITLTEFARQVRAEKAAKK